MHCTSSSMHTFLSHGSLNLKTRRLTVKSTFYFPHSLKGERTAIEMLFGTSTHKYIFSSDSKLNEIHHKLRPITVEPLKHCH